MTESRGKNHQTKQNFSCQLRYFICGKWYASTVEKIFETLENDNILNDRLNWEQYEKLEDEDKKRFAVLKARRLVEYQFIENENIDENKAVGLATSDAFSQLEWNSGMAYFLNRTLFSMSIYNGTSDPEVLKIAGEADILQSVGSFALTELAHGSNTKGMQTTATYDPNTKEFVLNTPRLIDMKCWSGNLGNMATHSLVFAQLNTPDGVCHGLHGFIVRVRDKERNPMPGITVGDMGHKLGLNGVSNGYMMFDNYRIPRTWLLDKNGGVTPEGKYVTPFKSKSKQFGALLGSLSGGRLGITSMAVCNLVMAVTIAVRYSSQRKQFGPEGGEEIPVIEYPMQQWRILPYLAGAVVWRYFAVWINTLFFDNIVKKMFGIESKKDPEYLDIEGRELHSLSCAGKSVATWLAQKGIQEAREACGGHGFLTVNRIGNLRDTNDPNCTYEGDNNCILMQTSNFLLYVYNKLKNGVELLSPLDSITFLKDHHRISTFKLHIKKIDEITPRVISEMFDWLVVYFLRRSEAKFASEMLKTNNDEFTAKNNSQVFYCRTLAIVFVQRCALHRFAEDRLKVCPDEFRDVIHNAHMLYALWVCEQYMATLYQGGYFTNAEQGDIIREAILHYCKLLKEDSLTLVNALAPPDWVLNSPIGHSNLKPLENLANAMLTPESQAKKEWWSEFYSPVDVGSKSHLIKSKL